MWDIGIRRVTSLSRELAGDEALHIAQRLDREGALQSAADKTKSDPMNRVGDMSGL